MNELIKYNDTVMSMVSNTSGKAKSAIKGLKMTKSKQIKKTSLFPLETHTEATKRGL